MVKAKINGKECIVYSFTSIARVGITICRVKYPHYDILLPVLAELIEVSYEAE